MAQTEQQQRRKQSGRRVDDDAGLRGQRHQRNGAEQRPGHLRPLVDEAVIRSGLQQQIGRNHPAGERLLGGDVKYAGQGAQRQKWQEPIHIRGEQNGDGEDDGY
ncbi:hypothetical protein D1872_250630 [compost metagenome]